MTDILPQAAPLPMARTDPFDPPAELALRGPMSPLLYPDGEVGWLVTGYTTAKAVLSDPRFSSRFELRNMAVPRPVRRGTPAPPGMFMGMDPPRHTKYRRLLTGHFTVRRMNELTVRVGQIVTEHLDAMLRVGSPADLVTAFATPVPSTVMCELLGVPQKDRELFQDRAAVMISLTSTVAEHGAASGAMHGYIRELIAAKRAESSNDILSGLVRSGELDDDEIATVGMLLLLAGYETTANMLGLAAFALLCHPAQFAALGADHSLIDNAVEELMRYATVVSLGTSRAALEDVEVEGILVEAGQTVTVALPAVNRDPARFADPDRLDVTKPASGHLAFGHGVHQCLGQQLARIELRAALLALADRVPSLRLAVPPAEVPMRHDMSVYGVHRLPVAWDATDR